MVNSNLLNSSASHHPISNDKNIKQIIIKEIGRGSP